MGRVRQGRHRSRSIFTSIDTAKATAMVKRMVTAMVTALVNGYSDVQCNQLKFTLLTVKSTS
jgi:hypothetical protein